MPPPLATWICSPPTAHGSGVLPHAGGAGGYVNFMVEADNDRLRATYGADKYDKLAQIKAQYDPDNVFHLNANIAPAPPR
jgi:hypothetical protein